MTHLDLDHTGGLPDFPHARVHVLQREYEAAMMPRGFKENGRYRKAHWAHSPDCVTYQEQYNEPWFGFDSIRQLNGLPPEIMLVRLPGHSRGHCGVAIHTSDGWLLHAGDTYYFHKQMQDTVVTTPMVYLFQRFAHLHYQQAMQTKDKLRNIALNNRKEVKVLCSHDTEEFESLSRTRVKV
jgi:glyoxylase-like metal-dependent hydrolase (beta-lactamase superfamily II)